MDERALRRALACVIEAGDPKGAALRDKVGPERLWAMIRASHSGVPWAARAADLNLDAVIRDEKRLGLRFVIPGDAEWPDRLADLALCEEVAGAWGVPLGLWVRGERSLAETVEESVAIVGSRAASPYGERVASELAEDLVSAGVTVVSGGAYGVDAAAHRGALGADGLTLAVLAGGLDQPYPRAHGPLLDRIAATGLLVSEYAPGSHPTRPRFLARNRLIAAASQATVLVEAAARSGARNTVTWASGCRRPVLAVPGSVNSATSYTPHRLIREGEAALVTCAQEVLVHTRPVGDVTEQPRRQYRLLDRLSDDEAAVYEQLPSRGARSTNDLALRSGLPVADCLAALAALEEAGLTAARPDGLWRLGDVSDRPVSRTSGVRARSRSAG